MLANQPGSDVLEPQPAVACVVQQTPALFTLQRLWNEAYDSLDNDTGTAGLTKAYIEVLTTVLMSEKAAGSIAPEADNISTKLKDPVIRQLNMRKLVEAGQAKVSKMSKITNRVGDVAQFILSAKGMIDLAIQNIPQAALPWAGVCIGLQILLNPVKATKSNLAGITHVVSRMDWYCNLTEHLLNKDHIIIGGESFESTVLQLEQRIVALYKALLLYQMKSVCSYYRNQGLVILRGLANLDDWDGDLKGVTDAEAAVQKDSDQYNNLQAKSLLGKLVKDGEERQLLLGDVRQALWDYIALQKDIHVDETNTKCLNELRVVDPQADMKRIENNKDTLLDKAYEWIIHTSQYAAFTNWDNEDGSQASQLLWIKGLPGTGKTMLLIGIIRELSDQSFKLAPKLSYFFCQGTNKTLNNATATLRSLIWMLLIQQPHLISYLQTAYTNSGEALFKDMNVFYALSMVFQSMLKDPSLSPVYFIIDALDECDQAKPGTTELIDLISTSLTLTDKVRWLLSSRPVFDGHTKLRKLAASETLLELDTQNLEGPVNAYIDHTLSVLAEKDGYDDEILTIVSNEIRQRAMNTFLWVALVFKELGHEEPWDAVDIVQSVPSGLLDLYDHMMNKIEGGSRKNPQYCKNVLVATSLAYRPLTLSELGVLAGLPPKEDGTVYLIHQSAKDYLDVNHTSRLQQGGAAQGHADISRRSIDEMASKLKVNMYALSHFGIRSKDTKPPDPDPLACLRYSCVLWIDHLLEVDNRIPDHGTELSDDGASFAFMKEHFLHWLESLSLIYKLSDGVLSIKKLLCRVQSQSTTSPQFAEFLEDSERFILNYRSIIEQAPLQTYGGALAFCPTRSKVKTQYWKERLSFIKNIRGIREDWDPCRQTLEGHTHVAKAVTFSPDGKVLASASCDETVRLWDTMTGAWKQTLNHSDWVNAVAFSPDGKVLASASRDKTVQLWDAITGASKQTLEGHSHSVNAVAFSPDGRVLASASHDKTVQLWDTVTGAWKQTLKGHSSLVKAITFSPDGKVLASASYDKTVQLWDAMTGAWKQTLEANLTIGSLQFSEDGQYLKIDQEFLSLNSASAGTCPYQEQSTCTMFINKEWVTQDGQNLLWLPPDYRAECSALFNNMLVLGHASGQVTFLELVLS